MLQVDPFDGGKNVARHGQELDFISHARAEATFSLATESLTRTSPSGEKFLASRGGNANSAGVPKWLKMCVAILLLPVCVATAQALWLVLAGTSAAERFWLPLLAGAACWVVVFILLPKPMWVYVLGHESTHAVWTWIFGGKVKRFKAASSGGHVVTTKTNFLITLAPYFFPFYAVLVVLVFFIGDLLWHWRAYLPWFHLLLGAAYAFHLTLTWEILKTRQTDITSQGYLFSAVVIFLGNAFVLLAAVPLLRGYGLYYVFRCWLDCNHQMLHRVANLI